MSIYIVKRIIAVIPILFIVSFLVYLIVFLAPGNPVLHILGPNATPAQIEELNRTLGLDQPFYIQYFYWLSNVLQGDFGNSIILHVPVFEVMLVSFKNTIILTIGSLSISVLAGILIGLLSGLRPSTWFDRISMVLTKVGANIPAFLLGLLLMWLFSLKLGWLPSSGMYDMRNEGSIVSLLRHLILPAVASSLVSLMILARLTRSNIIDVMNSDYIQTFRSHGIPRKKIIQKHLSRNIVSPLINMTGLQIGNLLSGVLFVEAVFAWPGIGSQLYNAISGNDYPMIQAGILIVAVSYVFVNLLTDIIIDLLNPRLRN